MVRGTGAEELSIADNDASANSVAIIDGQDVVHAGIEAWLTSGRPPIKIVGNYSEPAEFIADHPAATDAVEFVLLALQYEGHGPEPGRPSSHRVLLSCVGRSHIEQS
jgi:hypothetical protein